MKKLDYIDGLKGIGALMVYLCHFVFAFYYAAYSLQTSHAHTVSGVELLVGKSPLNLLYSGNTAVCLFLILSGFVLCLSYFKTRDRERLKASALKRYFRLMPVILAVNLFIFVLMSLGLYRNYETAVFTKSEDWFQGFNHFAPNLLEVLKESLIGCFLWGSNDYNGVLWTIPQLFLGALLIYLTAYLVGEKRWRYVVYAVLLVLLLRLDIYYCGIFLGFVLCDFVCTQERWMGLYRKWKIIPVLTFLLGLYLASYPSIGLTLTGTIYGILPGAYTVIYHTAGAFLLIAGVVGCGGLQKFFGRKPFTYLGKISFSLYLLHFPVIATFSCWFFLGLYERLGYHLTVGLDFVVTTVLALSVSGLSQRYLEPLGKRLEDQVVRRVKG